MRVLVVTGDLDITGEHPWLVDDLVRGLVDLGASVDVVRADPRRNRARASETAGLAYGLVDLAPPPWTFGPATRLLGGRGAALLRRAWTSGRLLLLGRDRRWAPGHYDGVVHFSIGTLNAGLPARLRRHGVARRSVFVLWDFFPVHQLEIGHMPPVPVLTGLLKQWERQALLASDAVAVMSPRNDAFMRSYFGIEPVSFVLPPWSTSGRERAAVAQRDRFTVVFGGQLTAGRDLGAVLEAARRTRAAGTQMDFLIVGDGPARAELERQVAADGLDQVTFTGRLPRADYRALASACHVGLSVTSADVSVPSFPSKIPEFLGLGLPVVAATEESTDAGEIVERLGAGLAARSGEVDSIVDALTRLAHEHAAGTLAERRRRAITVWQENFSVESATREVLFRLGQS
ncbi:glycosyltransferase family 4 protein [Microvirga sp. 0TCS3.31]